MLKLLRHNLISSQQSVDDTRKGCGEKYYHSDILHWVVCDEKRLCKKCSQSLIDEDAVYYGLEDSDESLQVYFPEFSYFQTVFSNVVFKQLEMNFQKKNRFWFPISSFTKTFLCFLTTIMV